MLRVPWSRVQLDCSFNPVTNSQLSRQMLEKGNVLQYKKNSSNLTQNQKYSLIARGKWINRTKTYATQTDVCSNPNSNSLLRNGAVEKCFPRSSTFQYDLLNPFICNEQICYDNLEDLSYNIIIDGGTLLANQTVEPCSQTVIKTTTSNPCNLTTASNVPGKIGVLCWDRRLEPWTPKTRYTMNTSANKWPTNYKGFRIAEVPKLTYSAPNTLTWTYCYNASSFTVFRNGAFFRTVLGKTTTTEEGSGTYYVVANVINASSGPSNVVVIV